MTAIAEKTDPKLWDEVKAKVTAGDKGGKPGQWSARKAQMAVQAYKAAGGTYKGGKTPDNHLLRWEKEAWGTASGRKSGDTGERYLPKRARNALSPDEYRRTSAKKRRDTRAGMRVSKQPRDLARKTAPFRATGGNRPARKSARPKSAESGSRAVLYAEARRRGIAGRSHMTKDQLRGALARPPRS